MDEKEKDGFIGIVAMRYGFREGQRMKKGELLRAQYKHGLDEIKQLGKQMKILPNTVKSLKELKQKTTVLSAEIAQKKQNMNSETVLEKNEVRKFTQTVNFYDRHITNWLLERDMLKVPTEIPVDIEAQVEEEEKQIKTKNKQPTKKE